MSEQDEVTLSEIEHFSFCERQWALIFSERIWADDVATVRGSIAHERVDRISERSERGRQVLRALTVWSDRLGLFGRADVVEMDSDGTPYPVEYKSGRVAGRGARLQLAGQALCPEEMFGRHVPEGSIWLGGTRRRVVVEIDERLREQTIAVAEAIRSTRTSSILPAGVFDHRCRQCSLHDECLPQLVQDRRRVATMHGMLFSERGGGSA